MEHRPYPKIASVADPSLHSPGGIWVAMEKLHGAQLVVGCDGAQVRIGKRKAWLEDDEPFFGWQLLRSRLQESALGVHRDLGAPRVIRLFGELFGGAYPHPDVAELPGLSAVQTGIWYAPNLHFALFDVVVEVDEGAGEFLSHREVETLAHAHGLLTVPLVGRGPRATLSTLPVRAPTRMPALLGLPPIADNIAEGLVLKPDARLSVEKRFVLKKKIAEFDDARFDEALPFQANAMLTVEEFAAHAKHLVNDARIASARSKVGTDAEAVRAEVVLDVLIDLDATFPLAYAALDAEKEDALRSRVDALALSRIAK